MNMQRYLIVAVVLLTLALYTRAQDEKPDPEAITKKKTLELLEKASEEYKVFFKRPENAIEYWAAIKFEIDLGKFDLAALHLKQLVTKAPPEDVDKDLVKLEQVEGMSAFLRLKRVKTWSDHPPFQKEAVENIDKLIDRITAAVEKHLGDRDRIKKFIGRLNAPTPEERAYAYVQIARSGKRAVPDLIEAIRVNDGKPLFPRLRETMLRLDADTVPIYLETLKAYDDKDYKVVEFRLTILEIIKIRDDTRAIPYLWHMSASKKYPDPVRLKAKEVLASLLRVGVTDLPPAKESLTALAEKYYQHKVPFRPGEDVLLHRWDGQSIAVTPTKLPPYYAEEFFADRYAKEALELDPGYQPAQVVLLSLMLERFYKPDLDQILVKPMPPKMHQLLTTIDADLVMRVLERGMEDRQIPIVLPLIQALGERGEYRAARLAANGQPRGVIAALYYPDRRVQFAAMQAMLRMPHNSNPAVSSERIVDLSRRFLAASPTPKTLVVYAPVGDKPAVRDLIKELGYEADVADKTPEAVTKGRASADFDWLLVHRGVADGDFLHVYSQLRQQYDLAVMPMVIVATKEREKTVQKLVGKDPGVLILPEEKFKAGDELKSLVENHIKNVQGMKLSADERKRMAKVSMDTLSRMAKGDYPGYNVMPALDVIVDQLRSPDNALDAIEILGRLPGKDIQQRLTAIVTNPAGDMKLRIPASIELNRHIHKNGLLVEKKAQDNIKTAHAEAEAGSPLRTQLTITMSTIDRPSAAKTGVDLTKFAPDAPAPKDPPKDKKDEK